MSNTYDLADETQRVLLLASYCDDPGCTDQLPCPACLVMCNVGTIAFTRATLRVDGGWEYLRRKRRLRTVRREPVPRLRRRA